MREYARVYELIQAFKKKKILCHLLVIIHIVKPFIAMFFQKLLFFLPPFIDFMPAAG